MPRCHAREKGQLSVGYLVEYIVFDYLRTSLTIEPDIYQRFPSRRGRGRVACQILPGLLTVNSPVVVYEY